MNSFFILQNLLQTPQRQKLISDSVPYIAAIEKRMEQRRKKILSFCGQIQSECWLKNLQQQQYFMTIGFPFGSVRQMKLQKQTSHMDALF